MKPGLRFTLGHFRCPHYGYLCVSSLPGFPSLSKERNIPDSSDRYEDIYFMMRWIVPQNCHLAKKQINSSDRCPHFNKWITFLELDLHLFEPAILPEQCTLLQGWQECKWELTPHITLKKVVEYRNSQRQGHHPSEWELESNYSVMILCFPSTQVSSFLSFFTRFFLGWLFFLEIFTLFTLFKTIFIC